VTGEILRMWLNVRFVQLLVCILDDKFSIGMRRNIFFMIAGTHSSMESLYSSGQSLMDIL
jgi:hypothetical protein